jgi:hypothetical protein
MGGTDSSSGATGVVSPDTFLLNISVSRCAVFDWCQCSSTSQIICSILDSRTRSLRFFDLVSRE